MFPISLSPSIFSLFNTNFKLLPTNGFPLATLRMCNPLLSLLPLSLSVSLSLFGSRNFEMLRNFSHMLLGAQGACPGNALLQHVAAACFDLFTLATHPDRWLPHRQTVQERGGGERGGEKGVSAIFMHSNCSMSPSSSEGKSDGSNSTCHWRRD